MRQLVSNTGSEAEFVWRKLRPRVEIRFARFVRIDRFSTPELVVISGPVLGVSVIVRPDAVWYVGFDVVCFPSSRAFVFFGEQLGSV